MSLLRWLFFGQPDPPPPVHFFPRYEEEAKPKLQMKLGMWVCVTKYEWGWGPTPRIAYEDWLDSYCGTYRRR